MTRLTHSKEGIVIENNSGKVVIHEGEVMDLIHSLQALGKLSPSIWWNV